MKNKTLKQNYTGVCHYCGSIFKNNRSTGRFCPGTSHRQMYGNIGSQINPHVKNDEGQVYDADGLLANIYEDSVDRDTLDSDSWSMGYERRDLRKDFQYKGPFPHGSEILVVGSYLLQKQILWEANTEETLFCVKPIGELTNNEKVTALIKSPHDEKTSDEEVEKS
ncbi:MAG: hypothetical protein EOO10_20335 [Chitinophagaceae bacterium]|nr:MAG: hypothetical protein EOO10_20335 [Chitinophagaceae bacterium]